MKISVNGKPMEVEAGLSVEGLLTLLNVKREFTAVAVNRDVIRRADYGAVRLSDSDKVEIVRPMGGG
jgi:sulfur carrier protein